MIDTFFRYLWFVIAVLALVGALRLMSWADEDMRNLNREEVPDVRQRN